jgi:hypothetical protein
MYYQPPKSKPKKKRINRPPAEDFQHEDQYQYYDFLQDQAQGQQAEQYHNPAEPKRQEEYYYEDQSYYLEQQQFEYQNQQPSILKKPKPKTKMKNNGNAEDSGLQLIFRDKNNAWNSNANDEVKEQTAPDEGCFSFLTHLLFGPKLKSKKNK